MPTASHPTLVKVDTSSLDRGGRLERHSADIVGNSVAGLVRAGHRPDLAASDAIALGPTGAGRATYTEAP